jgi:aromatic ring-opening dioxygenase LigB subunit
VKQVHIFLTTVESAKGNRHRFFNIFFATLPPVFFFAQKKRRIIVFGVPKTDGPTFLREGVTAGKQKGFKQADCPWNSLNG